MMVTLFGFLLFWFGFVVTIVGTIAIATKSPYREVGVAGAFIFFMMSGVLLMGSAGVNLSYQYPRVLSWPVAIILWIVFIGSLLIAAIKPSITKGRQEDT